MLESGKAGFYRGKGVLRKFVDSTAGDELREFTMNRGSYPETKVLFQFLGLTPVGSIREYRRAWYRAYDLKASAAHGSLYTKQELLSSVPHREIQFQISINLASMEIVDIRPSKKLEALLSSPASWQQVMYQASKMNER